MRTFLAGMYAEGDEDPDDPADWTIYRIRDIGSEEFQLISTARSRLRQFRHEVSLHNIFAKSAEALEAFRKDAERQIRDRQPGVRLDEIVEDMNARLMSMLSYFKTFLEYWRERFRTTDPQFYQDLTAFYLQTDESYRLCYYLRNFAQHYGSPLVNCVISSDPTSVRVAFTVSKRAILTSVLPSSK